MPCLDFLICQDANGQYTASANVIDHIDGHFVNSIQNRTKQSNRQCNQCSDIKYKFYGKDIVRTQIKTALLRGMVREIVTNATGHREIAENENRIKSKP